MKTLYEVYLVYGEDRKQPVILKEMVIADSEEDAKVKSGLHKNIDPTWEADFLTFEAVEVIDVKIKERPREVKNV